MKNEIKRALISTIGIIILGLSINLLSWQFKLISTGLPGYALLVNYLTKFPVGSFLLVSNTLILIVSFLVAGKTAGIRGIYGYVLLSLFIDWSKFFLKLNQVAIQSLPMNIFLIILQGFLAPIGIALVMTNGYSFGSYSSMMPVVNRFSKISPPKFFFIMDLGLAVITLIFFGSNSALLVLINAATFFVSFKYALVLFASLNKRAFV